MSGVLHPVGPEPARTYWFRRAVVLAAMVLVLTAVVALTGAARRGRQQTVPQTAAVPAPTATLTPSASSAPAPAATPLVPAEPTTAVSPAASATASTAPSPTADQTPAAVKACEGSALRTTLRGDQALKPKDPNTFTLSLINGGPDRCIIQVTPDNFELRIYSGIDRIWTTRHCSTVLKPIKETVRSEAAVEWQVKWNGLRSANACKNGPGVAGAGTYIAAAQLDGAQPVQLRMVIAG